jgi:uncharacterized protein with von Willebrand factor type A (vWA) domain
MTSHHRTLFPDDPDPVERWRADADEQDARFGQERRAQERAERRTESRHVALLRGEIAELRAEMVRQQEVHIESFGQALGEYGNRIVDHADAMIRRLQTEIWGSVERRLAELQARVDVVLDAKPRGSFKFANERIESDGEPVELPNPLPSRRNIN